MNGKELSRFIYKLLTSKAFSDTHKSRAQDFTRNRTLSFKVIFVTILRKSVKSLSIVMNELFMDGHIEVPVTPSAYTQARSKLRYTAFKELSDSIVEMRCSDPKYTKLWRGYRLLGVDGSYVILPNTPDIVKEYGKIRIKNQKYNGNYCSALFLCYYDVINNLTVASALETSRSYEVNLATELLDKTKSNDVSLFDRGFCTYKLPAIMQQKNRHFIIRCQKNTFKAFEPFFNGESTDEIVTLNVPEKQEREMQRLGVPSSITVRLVAVTLSTGEIEVLMTSLTDPEITREDFKELYGMRWGIETFFGILKGRLSLENFTGQSVESVKQDFWSTLFISNYESIMTSDVNQKLKNNGPNVKKVNKAVAFNVIKHQAFNILYSEHDEHEYRFKNLEKLFMTGAVPVREDRNPIRKKPSMRSLCGFLKRKKKHVY